jgi:hypothetical protein
VLVVLHVQSRARAHGQRQASAAAAFAFRRALRGDLGAIAELALSDPTLTDVRAVGGLTHLRRGAARMRLTFPD